MGYKNDIGDLNMVTCVGDKEAIARVSNGFL